jgi:L-alanine-DL-glutamate epimerase-like enolase superfamily enzyme
VLPEKLPRTAALALNLLRHDIIGHATGQKLSAHALAKLGPSNRSAPPGCRSFSIPDDPRCLRRQSERDISQQFHVLKLKLGSGDLGLDLATSPSRVTPRLRPQLMLDVNGGWGMHEAALMIEKLSHYSPALIEQPIHHRLGVEAWEELRASIPGNSPPLFADESVQTAADVPALARLHRRREHQAAQMRQLRCRHRHDRQAREHSLQILLGCMIETSLGTTAAAHLAPWADWIDLDGHFYVANDDFDGIAYDADGRLLMPLTL